jgi:hypothetical protein
MACDERQTGQQGMMDVLNSIRDQYPDAMKSINSMLLPTAQAQLEADKAVSEPYAALQQELQAKYAPEAAKTAAGVQDITDKAASARELELARTTGKDLVTEADTLQRQVDPEFYKNRTETSDAISKYLSATDPTLSENDAEEIRRATGRTVTNPSSAIDSAQKAMRFGSKLDQKRSLFGEAISRVSAALPSIRSGQDAFNIATRRAAAPTGANTVAGVSQGSGTNAYGLANNWLNNASQLQNTAMSKQNSLLQNVTGWGEFGGKVVGAIAGAATCWVAREVYGEDNPMWLVFRYYVINDAPKWFHNLYRNYGERFAKFISDKPILKRIIRGLMNLAIRRNYAN